MVRFSARIALAIAALAVALPAAPARADIDYVLTDLKACCTLNGSAFNGAYLATAINDNGDVVGNAYNAQTGFYQKGFALRNGAFKILNYLPPLQIGPPDHWGSYGTGRPTPFSAAADINEDGVVVGSASDGLVSRHFSGGHHAAVWRPYEAAASTEAFDLGAHQYDNEGSGWTRPCNFVTQYPPNTGSGVSDCFSDGRAINDNDDVAGEGEYNVQQTVQEGSQAGWPTLPFLIPGGNRKLVVGPEASQGTSDTLYFPANHRLDSFRVTGVNNTGQVVVNPNPATPTDTNSSAVYSGLVSVAVPFNTRVAHSINDSGWIVGNLGNQAKLSKGGSVVDLPPLAGDLYTSANAINNKGDVVGKSFAGGGCWKAVKWPHDDQAHPVDLNTKIGGSSWHLWDATAINDKGQVVGDGRSSSDCPNSVQFKPYLITPPPALSIADAVADEPETGTVDMTFTVSLGLTVNTPTTVDYATSDGTGPHAATAGDDYTTKSGTLTFEPGDTSETFTVPVKANGFQTDRTFFVDLSNASGGIEIDDSHAIGTIRGRGPLEVTLTPAAPKVDVPQTAQGPVTQDLVVDVAIKNRGKTEITTVTVPDKLTTGWDGAAEVMGFPITQTPPAEGDRTIGPIPANQTKHATYTLHVSGDGKYTLDILVLGDAAGQTVKGFATTKFEADTQLLVYTGEQGAKVRSPKSAALIKAGTPFLVNITLENRSLYRTILVNPIYPDLTGNASDGHVQERDVLPTAANPVGSTAEVNPSKYLVLLPKQKREFASVVRTTASDAFEDREEGAGGVGGTRAMAKFKTPVIREVKTNNELSDLGADRVSMTPGSTDFMLGVDDSAPDPAPFSYPDAAFYVGKGAVFGLWRLTWGTARGILWDLPTGAFFGAIDVSMGTLNAIDRTVELWTALESDPVAKAQYINAVADKVATAFEEAPYAIALGPNTLFNAASNAVGASMTKMSKEWEAGDWRPVLTENVAGSVEAVATVAQMVGPGILARFPAAASRWQATKAALYAKVATKLAPVTKRVTKIKAAATALKNTVKPGFAFEAATHMPKMFGVSSKEATKLANFAKNFKPPLSVVLRSRAQQSIKFLEDGLAVVKPYWIKTKNVSHADVEFLGYHVDDIGKVVLRKPISKAKFEANLAKKSVKKGTPQYKDALDRYKTRVDEYNGEYKKMQKWHKEGKVKGKWPWEENGVDPRVRADEYSTVQFKLFPDKRGNLVPKVYVKGSGWKFITGDIDLIAVTKANGGALSDLEHVAALDELKHLIGAQHPESATWVKGGKFWFDAKRNYLTNDGHCCLAQFGPDGKIRAVEFNEKLSEPEKWTKLGYRIVWKGGYQVGPGQ